jgi:hypothetical protein
MAFRSSHFLFPEIYHKNALSSDDVLPIVLDLEELFSQSPSPGGATTEDITWANLETAYFAGTLTVGTTYHVTDAPDGSAYLTEAWFTALNSSELACWGNALLTNTAPSDAITARPCQIFIRDGGSNEIEICGYKDAKGNEIFVSLSANLEPWLKTLRDTNTGVRAYYASLTPGATPGAIGSGSFFGPTCGLQMDQGAYFQGTILNGGSANLKGTDSYSDVYIDGRTVNTITSNQGYTVSGKVCTTDRSTFEVTASDFDDANPSFGTLNMQTFLWAGVIICNSDNGGGLATVINHTYGHDLRIKPSGFTLPVYRHDHASGVDIYLDTALGTSVDLDASLSQYIDLWFPGSGVYQRNTIITPA